MKKLGVTAVVCFLSAALAACQSGQPEVTATAVGAICTYEDGVWDCGDGDGGGGGGGGGGIQTCPSGGQPACVQCSDVKCVTACIGDFACQGDQIAYCGWRRVCAS
jgi:hypothetical protein